jgi:hypothetical protein
MLEHILHRCQPSHVPVVSRLQHKWGCSTTQYTSQFQSSAPRLHVCNPRGLAMFMLMMMIITESITYARMVIMWGSGHYTEMVARITRRLVCVHVVSM